MKRFFRIFTAATLVGTLFINALPAFAAGHNSIVNPQVTQASTTNANLPANWTSNKWGTNTSTMTYVKTEGRNDTTSLRVQSTAYTSGDVKWMHDNVTVKPSTSYTFTDWSKSNVATKLTVQYTSTTGTLSYVDLIATVPASATAWRQNSVTFTTPANVKQLSMFHLLSRVGWLQTDDFSLVDNSATSVIAPTVTIAAPTGGSTVSGTTAITANANGGSGTVAGVQFKINGTNLGVEDTTAPYSINWDTKTVANGAHTISATVRSSTAATANSTNVSVSVNNPVEPAPNTPPTVSITAPANNATVSGKLTVTASASDTDGIAGVLFKINNTVVGTEDTVAPYSFDWDTAAVADGAYTLTATARDSKGAATTATNAVTVRNIVAPTVTVTSPAGGSTVSNTTPITATANGGSGKITGVQFKVDGINVGTEDTTAPYSIDWDTKTIADGAHSISATVRNSQSNSANSTNIAVTVSNPVVPTPPTVSITAPANNATVSGTTAVTANATDTDGVAGVTFSLNGTAMGAEDTTAPYSINWDTKAVANGQHTLTATARDSKGATATATTTVTVNNTVVVTPSDNLVANASLETADPANAAKPNQWQSNSWGTNTSSFTYPVAGPTSSKAARTTVTTYTDGDAKWYFNPVAVSAGSQYTVRDMYRSSVATDVVAMYTSTTGAVTYGYLGNLPAAATWTAGEFQLTTPAGTASMSVFHTIAAVGFLEIDDASVTKFTTVPSSNPIANPSLETASGTQPAQWLRSNWGTNTAAFEYVNEGRTGNKSVKTTITNYTDGDAKWFFSPINTIEKGKMYRWSTWFKTNTQPEVVAMFTTASGTTKYLSMQKPFPNAAMATNWTQYSETFMVPQDAVSVSVFMLVKSNGWVQVDDQDLVPYTPTGFNRPLVTLTFDDGHQDNVTNALPVMNQYGLKSTQCYSTMYLNDPATAQSTINAFTSAGHEICSHTISHPFLTSLNSADLTKEITESKAMLERLSGKPVQTFAVPFGDYNEAVNNELKKYYTSSRTVEEGYNSKDNFDPYRLRVQNILPTTTVAELNGWLAQASATNTWLILVYHDVVTADKTPTPYGSYAEDFKQQMAAISASGLTVRTYVDALAETRAQL